LLEAIRNGTAPAAFVTLEIDPIIGLGSILGDELYGRPVPVVVLSRMETALIRDGDYLSVASDGVVLLGRPANSTSADQTEGCAAEQAE
jgi:predicted aconitase with swiveling domain